LSLPAAFAMMLINKWVLSTSRLDELAFAMPHGGQGRALPLQTNFNVV
jgi:hypothetical protein